MERVRLELQGRARKLDRPLELDEQTFPYNVEGQKGTVLKGLSDEQRKRQRYEAIRWM